jgi:hypothetical protein
MVEMEWVTNGTVNCRQEQRVDTNGLFSEQMVSEGKGLD